MNDSPRLQQLLQFYSASPDDAFLLFALAKEHEKLGNMETALDFYQKIVSTSPDYVGVYYHLGKLLEKARAPEQALETYKSGMAVAKKIGDQHAFSELAEAKLELDDE
ncbi:MAG: tetratricopeptide repeat protein [Saprospiraceae bacterium]|nr:tetratricopeptide repeat protein [Saprospiraceae bacterium]MCF8250446.1 tetratricopeptide repeat protein [Saprospiraceae bacterium]MCF8282113.1 tetratricopeptide repeat protein [Bacteroidales bacterium]MCF8312408.1 tetratricopeptide repeat protein [Saprospiraceae bacterium]MCF8440595.1 tetratricopeptide repeat protein [Saprospiraceae bacterium]